MTPQAIRERYRGIVLEAMYRAVDDAHDDESPYWEPIIGDAVEALIELEREAE